MNKKIMLLALAAVSAAMFALPAAASATHAHIQTAGETFTVTVAPGTLTRTDGLHLTCTGGTGNGSFDLGSTTTGTVSLTFTGCKSAFGHCQTKGTPTGVIHTGTYVFHLITLPVDGAMAKAPGLLITPSGAAITPGQLLFSDFECVGSTVTVFGNGIIGTLDSACGGAASKTHTLTYGSSATGVQTDLTWTGVTYDLTSTFINASHITSSIDTEATITFPNKAQSIVCT
jgi:hypothetical protein